MDNEKKNSGIENHGKLLIHLKVEVNCDIYDEIIKKFITDTPVGFTKINFRNLDLLIRERVFELVTPRMKYLLRDYVCVDLKMVEFKCLEIHEFENYKSYSLFHNSNRKFIYVDDDYRFIKEMVRLDNGEFSGKFETLKNPFREF